MSGRTPSQAVREYLQPLQRSVSCVTTGVLDVRGGYYVAQQAHTLALANGDPVPLNGNSRLLLTIIQSYRIIEASSVFGPYQVLITGYSYTFDDSNGSEVLSFQFSGIRKATVRSHFRTSISALGQRSVAANLPGATYQQGSSLSSRFYASRSKTSTLNQYVTTGTPYSQPDKQCSRNGPQANHSATMVL